VKTLLYGQVFSRGGKRAMRFEVDGKETRLFAIFGETFQVKLWNVMMTLCGHHWRFEPWPFKAPEKYRTLLAERKCRGTGRDSPGAPFKQRRYAAPSLTEPDRLAMP
jgi:hypothetical protein